MQTNKALYFPDTGIETCRVYQELLFFEHIYFYQISEDNPPADETEPEACSGYPPLPLGEDLDRFQRLIAELKGHEQEFYSGQLSSMALQNLEYRDEKTVRDIISSVADKGEKNRSEALWHYRLLLKLAEIRRKEEEELDRELAGISEKEASLYDSLKGDPELDQLIAGSSPVKSVGAPDTADTVIRAWGHLFLNDTRQNHRVLLTSNKDAAESLLEAHSSLSGGRLPTRLCRLTLPSLEGLQEETWIEARNTFQKKAGKVLEGFTDLFARVTEAGKEEDTLQKSTVLAAEWGSLIEDFSPGSGDSAAPSCGSKGPNPPHLEIYLCDCSLAALVARHCRLSPISDYADDSFGLIALKTSRPITCTD